MTNRVGRLPLGRLRIQVLGLIGMAVATLALGPLAAMPFAAHADTAETAWQPETFTLDNGMDVIVLPDHRAPVVTHMVWYRVGAVDEAPGKSGIAHLFEHVMFQETDDLAPGEFSETVTENGGTLNAFTSWDYTAYFERVARDRLELVMGLEAERMRDLIIDDDPDGAFISERDVVKEERRQRIENNPGAILFEKVMAALYEDHPYGIPVIGRMEEVAALTPDDGRAFYETWYAPNRAILVVAGDVTAEEVRPLAEATYGKLSPSPVAAPDRGWQAVRPLQGPRVVTHSDPKVRQEEWARYYHATSFTEDSDLAYALRVGLHVLGGTSTSRLYRSLVDDQALAVDASAGAFLTLHDRGPALVSASPAPGVDLDTLGQAVMAEVEAALRDGLARADVERAREQLAAQAIYARDSQMGMAMDYGRTLALGGAPEDVLTYADRMRAVTPEAATQALRQVLGDAPGYVEARLLRPASTGGGSETPAQEGPQE